MKTGAALNRGGSRQDYETPENFIQSVEERFGEMDFDLAASQKNSKAERFYNSSQNSLEMSWDYPGNLWLNPPFGNISAWAKKCFDSRKRRIFLLIPASVGSNYFRDYIFNKCLVLFLNGRLTFVGETSPFPKDCMLCIYGGEVGTEIWNWR